MKVRYKIREGGNILGLKGITHPNQLRDLMVSAMKGIGFYVQGKEKYIIMHKDNWVYLVPKSRLDYYGHWRIPFDFVEEAVAGKKYNGNERSRGMQYFYVSGSSLFGDPQEEFLNRGRMAALNLGEATPDDVLGLWRI